MSTKASAWKFLVVRNKNSKHGGYAVSSEYKSKFKFTGGEIIKVMFDVANDAYIDVERKMEAALARD